MDPGRELFERLKAEGWALVERWLRDQEPETLHLEVQAEERRREGQGAHLRDHF